MKNDSTQSNESSTSQEQQKMPNKKLELHYIDPKQQGGAATYKVRGKECHCQHANGKTCVKAGEG